MQIPKLPHDFDDAQSVLANEGYTDGLPVVPPTPERIERMLAANGCAPDAVVALLPPLFGEATWRAIAANAVMAGCRDDCLPVVGAAIAALAAPEFNLIGIATTTGSATPLVIVSGPVAERIGMNWGANVLGTGNRANATIGRAVHLAIQNIGGARPGEVDMSTLGQPAKYTFCGAENPVHSPWPSLAVRRGHAASESVVTVVGVAGIVEVIDSESQTPDDLARTLGASALIAGSIGGAGLLGGGEPLFIIPPEHAQMFNDAGWSLEQVQKAIFENTALPTTRLSSSVRAKLTTRREDVDPDIVRAAVRPDDVMIVVAGGVGRKAAYVPTWGGTTKAVSRVVQLSDA